jgi:hypothetical protein
MYQKDSLGNFVRDSMGNAVVQEFGLIGYPQFQIDGNPPTVYSRNWSSSNQGVLPMSYREEILDNQGNTYHVSHDAMEYVRDLSSESKEYLLATAVQQNNDACINIWIGLQFDPNSIKVLSV